MLKIQYIYGKKKETQILNVGFILRTYFGVNVDRGFAAQKSFREHIPWFLVYSKFNIFSV